MKTNHLRAGLWACMGFAIFGFAMCANAPVATAQDKPITGTPPLTPEAWAAIGKLPDWSGVWTPDWGDQNRRIKTEPTPWKPEIQKQVDEMFAADAAGKPKLIFHGCFPHAMPAWMLVTHNAMEILFTPGRVTMLGEADGNRLRRIYTDGRKHPEDPDVTFHGHSIGHWEGETLVVDTVSIKPQTPIALNEAVGIPNNGDMHIKERMFLVGPNELHVELEITAPKVLTRTWKTTRKYYRQRQYDIVEGVCVEGMHSEDVDANGNATFTPLEMDEHGTPIPRRPK